MYPFLPRGEFDPAKTGASDEAYWRFRGAYGWAVLALLGAMLLLTDRSLPTWLAIGAIGLVLGASFSIAVSFGRYLAAWDELQRELFYKAGTAACVGTGIILAVNAFARAHHLMALPDKVLAFVPFILMLALLALNRRRMR